MESELAQFENQQKINLQRLDNHIQDMHHKIREWRISTYKRNWYFRYLKNWKQKQLQYLDNLKENQIKDIHKKYDDLAATLTEPTKKNKSKTCLIVIHDVDSTHELQGNMTTAFQLKDILKSKYDYLENDINILSNADANRNNILNTFTKIVENAKEGDSLFVVFSSYGLNNELGTILKTHQKKGVRILVLFDNGCHENILDLRYQYLQNNNRSCIVNLNCEETKGEVVCIRCDKSSINVKIDNLHIISTFFECIANASEPISWETCVNKMSEILETKGVEERPLLTSGNPLHLEELLQL